MSSAVSVTLWHPLYTLCRLHASATCVSCSWHYKSESELDGSTHWGLLTTYSGAGNIQDMKTNKSASMDIVQYLFDNLWIRRGTRVAFIDFNVYNANINLFCIIRYVAQLVADIFLHDWLSCREVIALLGIHEWSFYKMCVLVQWCVLLSF